MVYSHHLFNNFGFDSANTLTGKGKTYGDGGRGPKSKPISAAGRAVVLAIGANRGGKATCSCDLAVIMDDTAGVLAGAGAARAGASPVAHVWHSQI
jgi:hypothetical protein